MRSLVIFFFAAATLASVLHAYPVEDTLVEKEASAGLEPTETGSNVVRDKRTIGVLRQLFPNFSQFIDRAIQMITRVAFRLIGRLVLGAGNRGGGGGDGGGEGDGGRTGGISIVLPTYPPFEDEDEDTEDTSEAESSPTTTIQPADDADNSVAESQVAPVRAKRDTEEAAEEEEEEGDEEEDLEPEATGDNDNEVDENDEEEEESELDTEETEDQRDKRFLNFNLGGGVGASAGAGGGAGSGNFIFDIIRLVAGSGNTQAGDVAANSPDAAAKDDANFGLGVPGPLTRLFVIGNRGIANLIQDIILRLAQTSERLVNFKARLITSLI